MSLSPFIPRRNDILGDRNRRHGLRGQFRVVGSSLGGNLGGLRGGRWGGSHDPLERFPGVGGIMGAPFAGLGRMGPLVPLGPPDPLGARRDVLSPHPGLQDLLLRGGRYPDLGRRALEDLHPQLRFGPYGHEGLLALERMEHERRLCDSRGCRGGLGCGSDRRCDHEQCLLDCSRCNGSSSGTGNLSQDLKTKDILIRGKTYKVRKSFLTEASKFEADIGKYLEKKSEDTVPNEVVQMLVDFINTENCTGRALLDFVTLNVLASSLGVKSAVEFSLNQIKKIELEYRIFEVELTQICVVVLLSGRVDDKLTEWLKKCLKYDDRWRNLIPNYYFQDTLRRKPELEIQICQLIGIMEKDDREDGLRIL